MHIVLGLIPLLHVLIVLLILFESLHHSYEGIQSFARRQWFLFDKIVPRFIALFHNEVVNFVVRHDFQGLDLVLLGFRVTTLLLQLFAVLILDVLVRNFIDSFLESLVEALTEFLANRLVFIFVFKLFFKVLIFDDFPDELVVSIFLV